MCFDFYMYGDLKIKVVQDILVRMKSRDTLRWMASQGFNTLVRNRGRIIGTPLSLSTSEFLPFFTTSPVSVFTSARHVSENSTVRTRRTCVEFFTPSPVFVVATTMRTVRVWRWKLMEWSFPNSSSVYVIYINIFRYYNYIQHMYIRWTRTASFPIPKELKANVWNPLDAVRWWVLPLRRWTEPSVLSLRRWTEPGPALKHHLTFCVWFPLVPGFDKGALCCSLDRRLPADLTASSDMSFCCK